MLTTYDGDEDIYRSLQAGAQGYLLKDMFFEELEDAIRKVHGGSRRIPTAVAERLAERMGSSDLTGRELEVLEQIVAGNSNKAIAKQLKISEAGIPEQRKKMSFDRAWLKRLTKWFNCSGRLSQENIFYCEVLRKGIRGLYNSTTYSGFPNPSLRRRNTTCHSHVPLVVLHAPFCQWQ